MSKQKIKYIVTNLRSGNEFVTYAVSDQDAINNIHYKLWFQSHIWTEMSDFKAEADVVIRLKELKRQEAQKKAEEPRYHQLSLFEVAI